MLSISSVDFAFTFVSPVIIFHLLAQWLGEILLIVSTVPIVVYDSTNGTDNTSQRAWLCT